AGGWRSLARARFATDLPSCDGNVARSGGARWDTFRGRDRAASRTFPRSIYGVPRIAPLPWWCGFDDELAAPYGPGETRPSRQPGRLHAARPTSAGPLEPQLWRLERLHQGSCALRQLPAGNRARFAASVARHKGARLA